MDGTGKLIMKIEPIIYNTTRGLINLEDKLSISNIFLFCYKLGTIYFSELLYTSNHKKFIKKLEKEYKEYNINLHIKLKDKNILSAFNMTLDEVKLKYDKDGFYKAVFEKDEFALACLDVSEKVFKTLTFY